MKYYFCRIKIRLYDLILDSTLEFREFTCIKSTNCKHATVCTLCCDHRSLLLTAVCTGYVMANVDEWIVRIFARFSFGTTCLSHRCFANFENIKNAHLHRIGIVGVQKYVLLVNCIRFVRKNMRRPVQEFDNLSNNYPAPFLRYIYRCMPAYSWH
jgi:hypothetical protein